MAHAADEEPPDWDEMRDVEAASLGEQLVEQGLLETLPTDVHFVRYITPDERERVHAQCLREQGFEVGGSLPDGYPVNDPAQRWRKPGIDAS